jgi:hypothetical protein
MRMLPPQNTQKKYTHTFNLEDIENQGINNIMSQSYKEITIKTCKISVFDKIYYFITDDKKEPYIIDFINRMMLTKSYEEVDKIKRDICLKYLIDTNKHMNESIFDKIFDANKSIPLDIFIELERIENDLSDVIKRNQILIKREDNLNNLLD